MPDRCFPCLTSERSGVLYWIMFEDQSSHAPEHQSNSLRDRLYRIIFLADTKAGRTFDIVLLWLIGISVGVVMLESVPELQAKYGRLFFLVEWGFTILFTIEYIVRVIVVRRKKRYI